MALNVVKRREYGERLLLTGVWPTSVVAINPTAEEYEDLTGKELPGSTDYVGTDDDGNMYNGVTIHLRVPYEMQDGDAQVPVVIFGDEETDDHYVNFRIYVKNQVRESTNKPGKFEWINSKGQTTWAYNEDDIDNVNGERLASHYYNLVFDKGNPIVDSKGKEVCSGFHIQEDEEGNEEKTPVTFRKAFVGESDLMNFLMKWLNPDTRLAPFYFTETEWAKLVEGDVSLLKEQLEQVNAEDEGKNNGVKVLLGVDDNSYQKVYTRAFMGYNQVNTKSLMTAARGGKSANPEYAWKCNYNSSAVPQMYKAKEAPKAPQTKAEAKVTDLFS